MSTAIDDLHQKQSRLDEALRELGSVLVAYSGGVDSAYLAWRARDVLGANMLAVIADSPSLAREQLDDALHFANRHNIPVHVLKTAEMENPDYVKNDLRRCFHCKSELFTKMEEWRARLGFARLIYGMNLDDCGDYRPGQQAAREHDVIAPLTEAGLTKSEIRALCREAGLQVWDKPASPCLSSRIAYGNPVTREVLQRIEQGEAELRRRGFRQFRVRDHAGLARIEIAADEMEKALTVDFLDEISALFKALGFQYTTLDCTGFRSGSLNAALPSGTAS